VLYNALLSSVGIRTGPTGSSAYCRNTPVMHVVVQTEVCMVYVDADTIVKYILGEYPDIYVYTT